MKTPRRRAEVTERLTDLALERGLDALVLRDAAREVGASDRMLIYYFGTKVALVGEVLACANRRAAAAAEAAAPAGPLEAPRLRAWALGALADPRLRPLMRLWTEVVARGARGEAPYAEIARAAVGGWLAWFEARLAPGSRRRAEAAAILALLEGASLLEAVSPGFLDGLG